MDKQELVELVEWKDACTDGLNFLQSCDTLEEAYRDADFLHLVWLAGLVGLEEELRVLHLRLIKEFRLLDNQAAYDLINEDLKQLLDTPNLHLLSSNELFNRWRPYSFFYAPVSIRAFFIYQSDYNKIEEAFDSLTGYFRWTDNPTLLKRASADARRLFSEVIPFETLLAAVESYYEQQS